MFREVTPDLFVVEQPFRFLGLEVGARMTVVRRAGGELWVYAPFEIGADEEAAIREKGRVREAVVPNGFHTTQVAPFARRFSDAVIWALPEVEKKLAGVPHEKLEGMPSEWGDDFDGLLFDGARGFREWAFLHRASGTLIITDLGFHLPKPRSPIGRIVARLDDVGRSFGTSRFEWTLMKIGNRRRQREQLETMLGWDFKRIIAGHGFVVERDAKKQMRKAFRFVGV